MTATQDSGTTAVVAAQFKGLSRIESVKAALEANTGGQGISLFQLDRVKVPSAGGTLWMVPSLNGEEAKQSLDGIIVHSHFVRSYWSSLEPVQGTPPECSAPDGVHGFGTPGGMCVACPFSRFNTAKKGGGKGQACKLGRVLYILRPDSILPLVLVLPPGSLANCQKFFLRLAENEIVYRHEVVSVGLEGATSGGGQRFSRATFRGLRTLEESERGRVDAYGAFIEGIAQEWAARAQEAGEFGGVDGD